MMNECNEYVFSCSLSDQELNPIDVNETEGSLFARYILSPSSPLHLILSPQLPHRETIAWELQIFLCTTPKLSGARV